MSFFILQKHCFNINLTKNKFIIITYNSIGIYISTFYLISYFFSYKALKLKNTNRIKSRIKRFLIPYIIWPTLIFLYNNIFCIFRINKNHIKLKHLFIQLVTGKRIYNVFWFQCNLIFTFILFSIIALSIKRDIIFSMQLLGMIGYFYHLLHYYYKLFGTYLYEIRSLFQDFGRVLFYSSIGITLASIVDIENLKKNRKKIIIFSLFSLYLIKDYLFIKKKLYYLRSIINGIAAISFFYFFSAIPNLNNKKIISMISTITNYTGGIYYLHIIIWRFLRKKIQIFKRKTLFGCFLNYFICYFICFLGDKNFEKSILKYLFN
jgi:fucose 4-O-acetylase-like acetyltransferase